MTGFAMGPALLFCPADRPDRFAKAVEAGQLPADAPVDELGLSILGAIILPVVGRRPLVAASVLGHVDFLLRPRG